MGSSRIDGGRPAAVNPVTLLPLPAGGGQHCPGQRKARAARPPICRNRRRRRRSILLPIAAGQLCAGGVAGIVAISVATIVAGLVIKAFGIDKAVVKGSIDAAGKGSVKGSIDAAGKGSVNKSLDAGIGVGYGGVNPAVKYGGHTAGNFTG